jgi:CheY-like chemotaxis protein
MIERNAKLQAQIINDLQDISRIARGQVQINVSSLDLRKVIQEAMEVVKGAAEAKQIQWALNLPPEPLIVIGDASRLQQVCWNLLTNAIKFSSAQGQIEIKLAQIDSQAEIQISDTGKGITADFLPLLFEPFCQQDASSTREHDGMGLGLAIVKQLVELHHGTVQAESSGEGQGATFTIRLPLAPLVQIPEVEPSPAAIADALRADALSLKGLRILLVEDRADVRGLLIMLLESYGAQVQGASSVRQALEVFPQFRPDVLVSDIAMPEEDGYALIRQVRERSPEQGGGIPAVAMTGYSSAADRQRALDSGFNCHVSKPVDADQLVALISNLVRG